jgi:hypothetical protein
VRKKEEGEGNKEKGKREKEKGEKKKKYERVIWTSYTSIQEVKPFCQTFSKTTAAPSEKPLHQEPEPFLDESEPCQTGPNFVFCAGIQTTQRPATSQSASRSHPHTIHRDRLGSPT